MQERPPAKPDWIKTSIPGGEVYFEIKKDLRSRKLVTVCEEAKCPNIAECWSSRTATFMVLGDTCTRGCRFCNVKTGNPQGFLNPHEPTEVALSCKQMGLNYVVITMVDRDDLLDGGANHVAEVFQRVQEENPGIKIEFLSGDFVAKEAALSIVFSKGLAVFAHNLETVKRLTPRVRDARASYQQSLHVLKYARERLPSATFTKSALMLGFGETKEEVVETMKDMRDVGISFLTIGQYMRPSKKHLSVKEWVSPEIFKELEAIGKELGFLSVASAPLVRSSYKARNFYEEAIKGKLGSSSTLSPLPKSDQT